MTRVIKPVFHFFLFLLFMLPLLSLSDAMGQTLCQTQTFQVTLATPLSSRINWKGDAVQAILTQPLVLANQWVLPAGSLLKGKVAGVTPFAKHQSAGLQIAFNQGISPISQLPIIAQVDTPNGWLGQADANTAVWQVSPNRSTRLLNQKIQKRLGSNRAVWVSVLGINENSIPLVESDAFMANYNRNDVLLGVGDVLQLRQICP